MRYGSCGERYWAAREGRSVLARSGSATLLGVASLCCCKFAAASVPGGVSLCGVHLLGSRFLVSLVSGPLEALAVELVEVDAVGLVSDEEIEHGPDQRETALLAGEPAHHLGPPFDLAERALEQIR